MTTFRRCRALCSFAVLGLSLASRGGAQSAGTHARISRLAWVGKADRRGATRRTRFTTPRFTTQ